MTDPLIAVRALNEYRRVSPLTYLSLRYLMQSAAARSNQWAREVAPSICLRQTKPSYWSCHQFKETVDEGQQLEYRTIHYPAPNEALAESALLTACSEAGEAFIPPKYVYSYRFAARGSMDGCFVPYFDGFSQRHADIGRAMVRWPRQGVLFTDIRRYYPSITTGRIRRTWEAACVDSEMPLHWKELGNHLIESYRVAGQGLLVGPLFSHLLGNLVLREFDHTMAARFPGRYFRYVDDIAVVIPPDGVKQSLGFIRTQLRSLGLKLNKKKTTYLSGEDWYNSARGCYTARSRDEQWMMLIHKLKCYLMMNPDELQDLARVLRDEGLRIGLPKYYEGIRDREYVARFEQKLMRRGFRSFVRRITIRDLVAQAKSIAPFYVEQTRRSLGEYSRAQGITKRWLGSQVKSVVSRLLALAPEGELRDLASMFRTDANFSEYHAMLDALASRDVSSLVKYSVKVCAAAGQALAASGGPVTCKVNLWDEAALEGLTTLMLLGSPVAATLPRNAHQKAIIRVVEGGIAANGWQKISPSFFQELAALSGGSTLEHHRNLMNSPIDPDERWVIFADELRSFSI